MANQKIGLDAVLNDSNFQAGMKRYTSGLGQMESASAKTANVLARVGSVMSGTLVVGAGAAVAAFGALSAASKIGLDNAIAWGEQLDKLSDQFGLTGEQASTWAAAFAHIGLSVEEGAQGLNFFTRGLADAAELLKDPKAKPNDFMKGLQQLGVRATDTKDKLKTFDQIMPDIMEAFKKLPPGVKATDLAMKLFGARGGSKFLDFLRQGKTGLKDAQALVKEFGLDMSTDGVNALEDFGFAMNDLNLKIKGMWTQIGVSVLPIVRRFVDYISANVLPVINKWVKESLPGLIAGFERFVTFAQTNLLPIWNQISQAFQGFVAAFQRGGLGGVIDELGRQLANAFKEFDLSKMLQNIAGGLGTLWASKIQPELAKWGKQFWGWLTGENGALAQAGTQLGKVITEIGNWAKTNAPQWGIVLETWKTDFWNWLTDPTSGAIAQAGIAIKKFSEDLRDKVASGETRASIESFGESISTEIINALTVGLTDGAAQTPMLIAFAQSLGETFVNLDIALDIIGTSFQRGVWIGVLRKAGFSDDEARTLAGKVFSYNVSTQFYLAAQKTGQQGGEGIKSGINSKAGAIAGAAIGVVNSAGNAAQGAARGSGYNIGAAFGDGINAAIVARIGLIQQTIANLLGTLAQLGLGGIPSFQGGGTMPHTGLAFLHKGEQVISAPANVNNSRVNNINFNHTWNGNAGGSDRAWTESMVRQVTQQEISSALGAI